MPFDYVAGESGGWHYGAQDAVLKSDQREFLKMRPYGGVHSIGRGGGGV